MITPRSNLRASCNASSCTATFCNSDCTYLLLSIIALCASRDHQCFLQQANSKWALLVPTFLRFSYLPPSFFFLPPSNPPPIRLLRDPCFTPFDQGRLIIVSLRNRCADTVETFVFERFAYSEFRETITFVERWISLAMICLNELISVSTRN